MNLEVHGEYTFKDENGKILLHKSNLITNIGEEYFLERWITNTSDILNVVSVGKGSNPPNKNDTDLQLTFARTTPNKSIDYVNNQIILEASFKASSINKTTEIGVFTNGKTPRLLSRDVHEPISIPADSNITIEYTFTIGNSMIKTEWAKYKTEYANVYTTTEPNEVLGVEEKDTGSGYVKVHGLDNVNLNDASYYWSSTNKALYIHTSDNDTPNNHTINVKY